MKRIARIVTFIVLFALVFTASPPRQAHADASNGFEITAYDVHTVVGEDNVYDITETIDVHFTEEKHGIYRVIPLSKIFERDAGDTRVQVRLTDIHVEGWKYSVKNEDGNIVIYFGSKSQYVTGDQTYRFSYRLHFGSDGMQEFDEVYYNIIGNEWSTMIDSLTFSVALPEGFDAETLGFSIGYAGTSGYDPAELAYVVDGNTIEGRTLRPLYAGEGVTLRTEYPQGFFDISEIYTPEWILAGIFGLLVLAGTILFLWRGIDPRAVVTVEFFPPEGMTPAEVGYVSDGYVDTKDVISLIIYWADKGFLTIAPLGTGYLLTQLRELDERAKPFERYMFNHLFKDGPQVETQSLQYKFYKTVAETTAMVSKAFSSDADEIFTKKSRKAQPLISFMSVLPVIVTLIVTLSRSEVGLFSIMIGMFLGFFLLLPMFWFIGFLRRWRKKSRKRRYIGLAFVLGFWAGAIAIFILTSADFSFLPALPWIASACTVVLALEAVFISRRTPRGAALLGKIKGFARFIEYAERDRILALVEQNPNYFYNILPYAYVLGITNMWAANFEGIALPPPQWYAGSWHSGYAFSPSAFASSFNTTMGGIQSHMSSSPSSSGGSGGGGSSGGGSSGGGGGGGGGGSW